MKRLMELGVIKRFTIDIDNNKLSMPEAILIINTKPQAINRLTLTGLDELKELYVTSDAAIISRISGNMQRILSIQDGIDLSDVNNICVIPVKIRW